MIANRYSAPEEDMAHLLSEKKTKLTMVVVGLIAGLVTMVGATALMYSDEPGDTRQPAGQSR